MDFRSGGKILFFCFEFQLSFFILLGDVQVVLVRRKREQVVKQLLDDRPFLGSLPRCVLAALFIPVCFLDYHAFVVLKNCGKSSWEIWKKNITIFFVIGFFLGKSMAAWWEVCSQKRKSKRVACKVRPARILASSNNYAVFVVEEEHFLREGKTFFAFFDIFLCSFTELLTFFLYCLKCFSKKCNFENFKRRSFLECAQIQ